MVSRESIVGSTSAQRRIPLVLRKELREPQRSKLNVGMRVGIEATPLTLTSGGLARYTSELSIALARCFPEDEYYLISDQRFELPLNSPANLQCGEGPHNAAERRWWLWGLNRELMRLGATLVHGPDFAVPYIPSRPSVLTLHDLSPWMDESWHANAERVKRRTPVLLELGLATMVITPSQLVRKQAIERFRLRPDRVVAVPEAAGPMFQPRSRKQGGATPYFLFVGTLEPRKNIHAMIDAWRDVRRSFAVELVIAGRRRSDFPGLAEESGLRLIGEVPDESLPDLYSNALAFVYPSLFEGFGLPILEAMLCGAPVIASSAVREAGGDAPIYADDAGQIALAMRRLLELPELSLELREHSLARAHQYSWDDTARHTREVYQEAINRFGN